MTITTELTSRYADNDGVRIHYRAGGDGPLIVLIHGFPDYWYTWRHQIDGLAATHSIAAMDTRGYNLSDAPSGQAAYAMEHLVDDVAAVMLTEGHTSATIVGHDWGGATAWAFARTHPEMTERLVIVNTPHPDNIAAALNDPHSEQAAAFAYAAGFRATGSEANLTAESLAGFVARDEAERERYVAAFERSDFRAMMHYYRANSHADRAAPADTNKVMAPVLQIHGMNDPTLLASSLDGTWRHLANTWSLVTIPGAGHNAHHDQPHYVTQVITDWLRLPKTVELTAPLDPTAGGCCSIEAPAPVLDVETVDVGGCCS